ncbi:MAG: hypothetical protein AB7E36_14815 [Salinivirgaceae bacterium]
MKATACETTKVKKSTKINSGKMVSENDVVIIDNQVITIKDLVSTFRFLKREIQKGHAIYTQFEQQIEILKNTIETKQQIIESQQRVIDLLEPHRIEKKRIITKNHFLRVIN